MTLFKGSKQWLMRLTKQQPCPQLSPASLVVTSPKKLVWRTCLVIALGSKPPPLTRIEGIGLGTRLRQNTNLSKNHCPNTSANTSVLISHFFFVNLGGYALHFLLIQFRYPIYGLHQECIAKRRKNDILFKDREP